MESHTTRHSHNHITFHLFAGDYHARKREDGWYGQFVPHGDDPREEVGPHDSYHDALDAAGAYRDGGRVMAFVDWVIDHQPQTTIFDPDPPEPTDVQLEAERLIDRWEERPGGAKAESGISFGNMWAEMSEEEKEAWLEDNAERRRRHYDFMVSWMSDARDLVERAE